MKSYFHNILFAALLLAASPGLCQAYSDHRGYNIDSLEAVAARWTPEMIGVASDEELKPIIDCWKGMMNGYRQVNGRRSDHFARKLLYLATERKWDLTAADAAKSLGQSFWAADQLDSSMVYFKLSMSHVEKMRGGSFSFTNPEGYSEEQIDDSYSSLCGAIGNLYYSMDSLSKTIEYYKKAESIFVKYGWNQSLAVLNYNMGEISLEQQDFKSARKYYETAMGYGKMENDSLWISNPLKGLGEMYLRMGRTGKALRCLERADRYFALHDDQEYASRLETLSLTSKALKRQKSAVMVAFGLAFLLFIAGLVIAFVMGRLKIERKERKETAEVLVETLKELKPVQKTKMELTEREIQVITLMAEGLTASKIAERVFLSPETIKWYRKKLLVKLNASNSAQLISIAKENNLI